ncbi:hypothetical protein ACX27_29675 [Nostoc piscinale CENA21]|uniref:Uncharacterized protein n=1 Tax=Nostoc piscinale CENA21 TaxID=224013 RepID=A0A0M4U0S1_9NOSO|nr:hypothetical protein ACX27_29675 [Nostoc piscinale CENA21]
MISTIFAPHPQPLPVNGEGRHSVAVAGWGSSVFVSNQADMMLQHNKDYSKLLFMILTINNICFYYLLSFILELRTIKYKIKNYLGWF